MKLGTAQKDRKTFKCDTPENTTRRIEKAFDRLGLQFEYYGSRASPKSEFHWGNLKIPSLNYFVEGKGMSAELAKASAYAEMVERISAGHAVKPDFIKNFDHSTTFPKIIGYSNFDYLDGYTYELQEELENPLKIETMLSHRKELKVDDIEKIKKSDICRHWAQGYSILREESVQVPIKLVHKICGTNGLAAGNTIEEAIVQASNEIFERHVSIESIKNKKIIPTIDNNSIEDKQIQEIIRFFKKNNIELIIKDFSNNGVFPCYGLVIKNLNVLKDNNPIKRAYRERSLRVASSFNNKEALLRCFTEKMQGKTVDLLRKEKYFDLIWYRFLQYFDPQYEPFVFYYNVLRKYEYAGDLSFLERGERIDFRDNEQTYDCLQEIDKIKRICEHLKTDFVVVDHTHPVLQFPVVRVIIPKLSDVLSYTRFNRGDSLDDQIIYPTRSEKDFEVRDDKFLYQNEWMDSNDDIKELIKEIIEYVKAYNTHVLYTFGLFFRKIDAFKLLTSLFLKLGDLGSVEICVKILFSLYPNLKRHYKYLQLLAVREQKEKLAEELMKMKGCERYLLSKPNKNPLVSYCDEECSEDCVQNYILDLKKLISSFYVTRQ